MKKIQTRIFIFGIIILNIGCSRPLIEGEIYSLTQIRNHAKDGQLINSKGILKERIAKREFVITDNNTSIKINLSKFKKEAKYFDKGDKIIFTGKFIKKPFHQPEVEVEILRKVDDFK